MGPINGAGYGLNNQQEESFIRRNRVALVALGILGGIVLYRVFYAKKCPPSLSFDLKRDWGGKITGATLGVL